MDDYEINVRMRNMKGYPADIIRRLNDRNLFKRALYVGFDAVDRNIVRYAKAHREIENEIARLAGIDPGYVIVDIPKMPEFRERNTRVLTENDQLKYIDDVSQMVRIVEESYVRTGAWASTRCPSSAKRWRRSPGTTSTWRRCRSRASWRSRECPKR